MNRSLEEAVEFSYNPEPRCPCVLLLDNSQSMQGAAIAELNAGLITLRDNLRRDPIASKRVDIAVISFNNRIDVVQDFVPVSRFEPPTLDAAGQTCMGTAILEAISQLNSYKKALREMEIDYFRPHVFLITDGRPEGEAESITLEAARRVREEESKRGLLFFGIGVRGADMEKLGQMMAREPLDLSEKSFQELIDYLSRSVSALSQGRFDGEEQRPLPPPGKRF